MIPQFKSQIVDISHSRVEQAAQERFDQLELANSDAKRPAHFKVQQFAVVVSGALDGQIGDLNVLAGDLQLVEHIEYGASQIVVGRAGDGQFPVFGVHRESDLNLIGCRHDHASSADAHSALRRFARVMVRRSSLLGHGLRRQNQDQ